MNVSKIWSMILILWDKVKPVAAAKLGEWAAKWFAEISESWDAWFDRNIKSISVVIVILVLIGALAALNMFIKFAVEAHFNANMMMIEQSAKEFEQKAKATNEKQQQMLRDMSEVEKNMLRLRESERALIKLRMELLGLEEKLEERKRQPVSRGGGREVNALITAFTCNDGDKTPGHPAYCVTASGYKLSNADSMKVVAADPKHYPAGTRLWIEGVGVVVVRDTGGLIKGPGRLDLFVGEMDIPRALQWGEKVRRVMVL